MRSRYGFPAALTAAVALAALATQVPVFAAAGDPGIPAPRQVIGFDVGVRPANYGEVVAYLNALDAASERITLGSYGTTTTGRTQLLLTISSPVNLARLDQVRNKLARLGAGPNENEARSLIAELPAVAWMGYSIHGDEISGVDAALEVAYRLASGNDAQTLRLLDRLVIYLDPMVNPDGRERELAHLTAFTPRHPNLDTQDLLHHKPWPAGRGNHYLFDLNRDAVYGVQAEARSRVAAIVRAQPQFLADAHEMGTENTHLFAVPAEPFNPFLPAGVSASWRDFARGHAEAFDRDGISFYTRSWNEVFYPGYFDILLAYHGGTPMIYEQAANAGTTVRLKNGRERTYAQAVGNQVRSSWADLVSAADHKEALLQRWWSARRSAANAKAARTWYVLPTDSYKLSRLAQVLRTQGVRFDRLEAALPARELQSIWGPIERELPVGTLRVRGAQPLGALVHNIFDFHVPMAEGFLERERRGLDLRQKTLLYDTTAWSVAHAFAVDVYWSAAASGGNWTDDVAADVPLVDEPPALAQARYGYVYRDPSLEVTARLLAQGVKVRVAARRFVHAGTEFAPGDLLIRRDDQPQRAEGSMAGGEAADGRGLLEVLRAEQAVSRTAFQVADSGRITDGPDLGGDDFHLLTAPRIAILAGAGSEETSVGALWYLFDAETGIPVTLLDRADLGAADLSRYDVLVLPDGDVGQTTATLAEGKLEQLQHWMRAGGTLIALRGGAMALLNSGKFGTKPRQSVIENYPPLMFGQSAHAVAAEDFVRAAGAAVSSPAVPKAAAEPRSAWTYPVVGTAARAFLPKGAKLFAFPQRFVTLAEWLKEVPGAAGLEHSAGDLVRRYLPQGAYLRVDLQPGHWLSYGVAARLPVMFRERESLIAEHDVDLVGRYAGPRELALAGLVWPEAVGYVAETAYLARESVGAGQLVLFAGDPVFRGYSLGTQRLFMNAAILGPVLR